MVSAAAPPLTYDILVKALEPLNCDLLNKYEFESKMMSVICHPRINHILNTMKHYLHELRIDNEYHDSSKISGHENIDLHFTMVNSYYIAIRNIINIGHWTSFENTELQMRKDV